MKKTALPQSTTKKTATFLSSMVSLFDHQEEALKKLHTGSILCGGVGSGKSITALTYFVENICGGKINKQYFPVKKKVKLYIITTARKRDTLEWEEEALPFLISKTEDSQVELVIDSWNNIKKYVEVTDSFFIFDEQRVVGKGAWAKSFIKIAKNNDWILLTATPGDTWMDYIPVFIANDFYRNRTQFIRQHVVYNRFTKYPKVDHFVNTAPLDYYRNKILVNMDYQKNTVQHKLFEDVDYNKQLWDVVHDHRWDPYDQCPIENASEMTYLLRKVVNSDPSRFETIQNLWKDHSKMIIFYNFDYELDILRKLHFDGTVAEWNGHKHEKIPNTDKWAYLVQYTAGCEGWNCVETDTIVFYSQNYSYKVMHQAAGRIDRLNTPFTDLYYYTLISKAPIDSGIRHALRRKKKFNESSWDYVQSQFNLPL